MPIAPLKLFLHRKQIANNLGKYTVKTVFKNSRTDDYNYDTNEY